VQNKKRHTDRSGWLGDGCLGFGLLPVLIQALAHPQLTAAQTSEVTLTSSRA
jgi:hypothetical protein